MKLIRQWLRWTAMVLTAFLIASSVGCLTSVVTIPADNVVVPLKVGEPFTPTNGPGFFVPQAKMLEILKQLERTK